MTKAHLVIRDLVMDFAASRSLLEKLLGRHDRKPLRAVDKVSFEIMRGETFALVGESGSGKSTLARILLGLWRQTSGTVTYDGSIGGQMVFQSPFASLNPRWRVGRSIAEPLLSFEPQLDASARDKRARALLEQVGLSANDADRYPHQFSGGQRQRIAIARALSSAPAFLVCDEPTSALDVSVQAQILNLLRDEQAARGFTCLFISHDLSVVRHMANRVGVLYLGRLVEVRDSEKLFDTPLHPYTRMLLASVPDIGGRRADIQRIEGEVPDPSNRPSGCVFHPRCPLANDRCSTELPQPHNVDGGTVACHAVEEGRN